MKRLLGMIFVAGSLPVAGTLGQSSSDPNVVDESPQDRVRGGFVQANAPGTIIRAAIARHAELQAERLTSARLGIEPNEPSVTPLPGGSSGLAGGTGSGTLLDSLLSQLGGGSLGVGSIDDLTNLVGGLTNLGGTTSGGTDGSGSGTGDGTGTDPRLQALLDLRDANTGDGTGDQSTLKSAQRSSGSRTFGGAIAKLSKPEDRAQSVIDPNTTAERSFRDRLLESWATATFTALTVGFQTPQFVSFLEDGLRAIFRPKASPELVTIIQALAQFYDSLAQDGADTNGTGDTGGDDADGSSGGGNDNTTVL